MTTPAAVSIEGVTTSYGGVTILHPVTLSLDHRRAHGAGGYGQAIPAGIREDDTGLIRQGAVPAAVLALLVQGAFDWLERWVGARGLRA